MKRGPQIPILTFAGWKGGGGGGGEKGKLEPGRYD